MATKWLRISARFVSASEVCQKLVSGAITERMVLVPTQFLLLELRPNWMAPGALIPFTRAPGFPLLGLAFVTLDTCPTTPAFNTNDSVLQPIGPPEEVAHLSITVRQAAAPCSIQYDNTY